MLKPTHRQKSNQAPCTYITVKHFVTVEMIKHVVANRLINDKFREENPRHFKDEQREPITRKIIEEELRRHFSNSGEGWVNEEDCGELVEREIPEKGLQQKLEQSLVRLFPDWFGSPSYQFIKQAGRKTK